MANNKKYIGNACGSKYCAPCSGGYAVDPEQERAEKRRREQQKAAEEKKEEAKSQPPA